MRKLLFGFAVGAASVAFGAPATRPMPTTAPSLAVERALAQLSAGGDWIVQWEAMETLAGAKSAQAVAPLRAILGGARERPWVRARALVTLARIQGTAVLGDVKVALGDPSPELRAAAAEAIGIVGDVGAKDLLLTKLNDADPKVRQEALVAYARLLKGGAWDVVSKFPTDAKADPVMAAAATRALVHIGTDAARAKLAALLVGKDRAPKLLAIDAIKEGRDPSLLPVLLQFIATEKDKGLAALADKAFAAFDDAQLAAPMLAALAGDNPALYRSAVKALAAQPTREVCDAIAKRLDAIKAADPTALPIALAALGRFDATAYQAAIAPFVRAEQYDVRRAAVEAIARAKGVDHFAILQDALADKEYTVRVAAYQALRRATQGTPKEGIVAYLAAPLASKERSVYFSALEFMRERLTRAEFAPAVVALDRFLGSADRDTRESAGRILAGVADEGGIEQVARAQGYVAPWTVIGPFFAEADDVAGALALPFPPEREIVFTKAYEAGEERQVTWALCQSKRTDGGLDLGYVYAQEDAPQSKALRVAYAVADLATPGDADVTIAVNAQQRYTIWLNDRKLDADPKKADTFSTRLPRGTNRLLVKVASSESKNWSLRVQVLDNTGKRIDGLTPILPQTTAPAATRPTAKP